MINVICYEAVNSISLLYKLNFLNTEETIKSINSQPSWLFYYRPVIKITWLKSFNNTNLIASVSLNNDSIYEEDANLSNLKQVDSLIKNINNKDLISYYKTQPLDNSHIRDTLSKSILTHLKDITNEKFIFEDLFSNKWKDVNLKEHQNRFDEEYFTRVMNSSVGNSKILNKLNANERWKIVIDYLLLESLIIENPVNSKTRKF